MTRGDHRDRLGWSKAGCDDKGRPQRQTRLVVMTRGDHRDRLGWSKAGCDDKGRPQGQTRLEQGWL